MKILKILTLILSLFFVSSGIGQNRLLGKVKNSKNEPVTNVTVYLDSVKTDAITNSRGFFEVMVPENVKEIHVFSKTYGLLSAGYSNETFMNFVYIEPSKRPKNKKGENEGEVSIGYGEIDAKDLTYNVNKIDIKKRDAAFAYATIYDLIKGRLTGVIVTNNNRIIIRGVHTLRGASDPLFVVDGTIVFSIDYIIPSEVKDISVLKGAAAAIYGSRGANGVIQITTKN